jgi:predicted P-loop ATPase/GTPase|eukprot:COSAG06_NODE_809_length_12164_cov_17.936179_3_plen_48_part_00
MIFEVMLGDMMYEFLKEVLNEARKLDDDTLRTLDKEMKAVVVGEGRP